MSYAEVCEGRKATAACTEDIPSCHDSTVAIFRLQTPDSETLSFTSVPGHARPHSH